MNERIRELAEQAGFQWSKFGLVATPDSNAEKFAELIVKECAKVIDSHYRDGMGIVIEKHFGVEE